MIGIAIKTEIKSEIKIEMEKVNMRNKYKGSIMPMNPNYIHPDGIPCKRARREASKLSDLPQVDDTPYDSLNSGLHVEIPDNANAITSTSMPTSSVMPNTGPSPTQSSEKDSVNGLPVETSPPNNKSPIMTTNTEINIETNEGNGLHVETNMNIHTETTEQNNRLPAEMSETNITNTLSSCVNNNITNTPNEKTSETEGSTTKSGLPVETVNIMDKKSLETETNDNDTVNDTALGLIMLHEHDNTGYDNLLEKI